MDEAKARWEINATLTKRGFDYVGPGPDRYRGSIRVGHTSAKIDLDIPDLNFVIPPRIEFVDRRNLPLPLVAHLEQGSGLCYADRTLLRLDAYAPGATMLRILEEAEKTIAKSLSGGAMVEIAQEFPRYWGGGSVQVLISANEIPPEGYLAVPGHGSPSVAILLVPDGRAIPAGFVRTRKVLIVRVARLEPLPTELVPTTLGQLEAWHSQQSAPSRPFGAVVEALAREEPVFYRGSNGWIGCELELPADLRVMVRKQNARPAFVAGELLRRKQGISLVQHTGSEASLDHVTTRNLATTPSLKGKRIALIGCGTIGSHLARYLVQSGAGNDGELVLIDNQPFAAGNLGRHLLNFDALGKQKAPALATELARFHPNVKLTPIDHDAMSVWPRLESADLIIDATGVEMVSDALNAKAIELRRAGKQINLLHVWLFANGVAAQSFLNLGSDFACYRCLRPDVSRPWIDDPRKNVKNDGTIAPAFCGDGPYLPFSVDAPIVAAAIALRSVLGFFGGHQHPLLRTAQIDPEHAIRKEDKSPRKHQECPACR